MRILTMFVTALVLTTSLVAAQAEETKPDNSMICVVMDPLAKPLSCPCVAGYAQRDYEKLGVALTSALGREVKVVFNESLVAAQKKMGETQAAIVIGKQSVILHDAKASGLHLKKIAMLTGKDGVTTQRGLVVVPTDDPAKKVSDLKEYRIFFGPTECDEKHAAALRLLKANGIDAPAKLETAIACDEGAVKILELGAKGVRGCAVISSYAKPLLEGCGQVPKGALRVIGETEDIPFIAAYVNAGLDKELQVALSEALLKSTSADVKLRIALETKRGFVVEEEAATEVAKKK